MTKHTPGPWTYVGFGVVQPLSPQANGQKITTQCFGPDSEANARLIAAAPDLLAACHALMRAEVMQTEGKRDGATMGQISLAIDAARAAIAKAKGA